jgi:hypothetical protein
MWHAWKNSQKNMKWGKMGVTCGTHGRTHRSERKTSWEIKQ